VTSPNQNPGQGEGENGISQLGTIGGSQSKGKKERGVKKSRDTGSKKGVPQAQKCAEPSTQSLPKNQTHLLGGELSVGFENAPQGGGEGWRNRWGKGQTKWIRKTGWEFEVKSEEFGVEIPT